MNYFLGTVALLGVGLTGLLIRTRKQDKKRISFLVEQINYEHRLRMELRSENIALESNPSSLKEKSKQVDIEISLEKVLRDVSSKTLIRVLHKRSVDQARKTLRNASSVDIHANEDDPEQIKTLVDGWWRGVNQIVSGLWDEVVLPPHGAL